MMKPIFAKVSGAIVGLVGLAVILAASEPNDGLAKTMLPIYVKEAEAYSLAIESDPKKELELMKKPIFEWANPTRNDQQGVIFLWLHDGKPAALASIFSYPHAKLPGRGVMHELHALDADKLLVKRDAYNRWEPEAGLKRNELAETAEPSATSSVRHVQMRKIVEEFAGYEIDREGKRWDLRLLPTPLFKYPTAKTGVVDGMIFAMVSNAGTDPEVLVLIEARQVEGKLRWEYACGRFSDWELHVKRKEAEVFASVRSETNSFAFGPQQLYRLYPDKVYSLDGKLLARLKQNPSPPSGKDPGTKLIPVEK